MRPPDGSAKNRACRFEYRILDRELANLGVFPRPQLDEGFEKALQELGAPGWELVSLVSLQAQRGHSWRLVAALERPLPE